MNPIHRIGRAKVNWNTQVQSLRLVWQWQSEISICPPVTETQDASLGSALGTQSGQSIQKFATNTLPTNLTLRCPSRTFYPQKGPDKE